MKHDEPAPTFVANLGEATTADLLIEVRARLRDTQNSTAGVNLADECTEALTNLDLGVLLYRTVDANAPIDRMLKSWRIDLRRRSLLEDENAVQAGAMWNGGTRGNPGSDELLATLFAALRAQASERDEDHRMIAGLTTSRAAIDRKLRRCEQVLQWWESLVESTQDYPPDVIVLDVIRHALALDGDA